jgi:isoleucyl-tRNA synthetase
MKFFDSSYSFQVQISEYYETLNYNKVCLAVNHFVSNHLSAFYFHLIKDRLYCAAESSLERQSAITTLWHILKAFRYQFHLSITCR